MIKQGLLYITIFITLFASGNAFAQQQEVSKEVYFESAPQGMVRFYYDKHYYLVDKHCPFKSIERVSQFIVAKNAFHGEFKDFDPAGRVVLTGVYNEGVKEGIFTAFHPNGKKKWEVLFHGGSPSGDWNYYYPDGKPMLTVGYEAGARLIKSLWDQKGMQRVVDGNGKYEFKMPFDLYNEYGFPFFQREGRLANGVPTGYWSTEMVDERNRKTLYTEEVYERMGAMTEAYNIFTDEEYTQPMPILPTEYFAQAEALTFKECSFDDFSGYYAYLSEKFTNAFRGAKGLTSAEDDFAYSVTLSKKGEPRKVVTVKAIETQDLNKYVERLLGEIPFFFPNLDNSGAEVEGEVKVSGRLSIDTSGTVNFHSFKIARPEIAAAPTETD